MTFKNERKKREMEEEFKPYKATVHLKHTGTELICDVIGEIDGIIDIENPCVLQTVMTEQGKSQLAMAPWLMTSKDNYLPISLEDVLFITECRSDIAEQHTQMHSSIILPKTF